MKLNFIGAFFLISSFSLVCGMDDFWEDSNKVFFCKQKRTSKESIQIPGKEGRQSLKKKEQEEFKKQPSPEDHTPVGPPHWLADYYKRNPEKKPKLE